MIRYMPTQLARTTIALIESQSSSSLYPAPSFHQLHRLPSRLRRRCPTAPSNQDYLRCSMQLRLRERRYQYLQKDASRSVSEIRCIALYMLMMMMMMMMMMIIE